MLLTEMLMLIQMRIMIATATTKWQNLLKEEPETEEQLAEHFLHTMVMVAASIEGDRS